jgi:hypothetical protein
VSPTIRPHDRRDSYRLQLDPGQAVVRAEAGATVEVRDLSASGGRLIVREPRREVPELTSLEIELSSGDVVRAQPDVVRARSHEPGVFHLGVTFRDLGTEGVHKLSRFIAREFERRTSDPSRLLDLSRSLAVTSPLFIRNVFAAGGEETLPLAVIDRSLRLGGELRVSGVAFEDGRRVIRARFEGEAPAALSLQRSYRFLMGGPAAVTVFQSRCLRQRGNDVLLALPEEIHQAGTRDGRRIEVGETLGSSMRVSFTHPRLPGNARSGRILDVAEQGLCFAVPAGEHGLFPGDRLLDLRIELPGCTLGARAVVRRIGAAGTAQASCGIELMLFATRADAEVWRRFVFGQLHPDIVDGNGRAEAAWKVLEGSKYVELWAPPAARAHVRQEYHRSWQDAASELGHSVLLLRERAVGMAAGSAVTPRSWVLHHLASDPGDEPDARPPLADAYRVISAILGRLRMETDLEHFLIYLERGKRWNDRLYVDFAARYFDPEKILLTPLEVHRRACDTPLPEGPSGPVLEATGPLLSLLSRRLAETRPALERKALALDEERIRLVTFSEACEGWGQERRRDIFFAAAQEGQPQAALIAESGDEGVNVFGLLNTCRIVALGEGAPPRQAREALLRKAVEHYRARGKMNFLLFEDAHVDDEPARLGFQRVSGGLRWIAHRDVIPAWEAYLEGLLAAGTT